LESKNANFFAIFFGENILKIITSTPGQFSAVDQSVECVAFINLAAIIIEYLRLAIHSVLQKINFQKQGDQIERIAVFLTISEKIK
jgi:hypothetical protein